MFALPTPFDLDAARRIVTDPAAARPLQRLAWAVLKTAQGHPVRQARLAAICTDTPAPTDTAGPAGSVPAWLAQAMAARRVTLRDKMLATRHTAPDGGHVA